MIPFLEICLIILISTLFIGIYFLMRNEWVYHRRINLIDKDELNNYLSYDEILYRKFWIWNIEKLRKK